jgi:arylsulfatase A-like enzyme
MPRNVVVILLDSLNRHYVGAYGASPATTPQLDRLAARSTVFTDHHTGSLPCMPARHDLLCGSLDFLWKPWGSIEAFEDPVTWSLRRAGVVTQLITDHPHLFESGGENYHTDFAAWHYTRGHEGDPWKLRADPSWMGAPALPIAAAPQSGSYDRSRTYFRSEEEFPGPSTMAAAAKWIRENAHHHDRFFLLVDEFDPHEPFDTPDPWASMYDAEWNGPRIVWPPYTVPGTSASPDERTGRHLRANYASKVSMIDHWLGRVLDAMDERSLWDDTALILLTDHGHYLGDRGGIWGKPGVPVFSELGRIPMMVAWPHTSAHAESSLTTTVDVHATLREIFSLEIEHRTHGHSLVACLNGEGPSTRDHVLTGVWGRDVTYVDRDVRFSRAPVASNRPLSMFSSRWSTMPVHALPDLRMPRPNRRAFLDAMPGSDVPIIRQPFAVDDPVPFWAIHPGAMGDQLFDRLEDPHESVNRSEQPRVDDSIDRLREALVSVSAPNEHLARPGID